MLRLSVTNHLYGPMFPEKRVLYVDFPFVNGNSASARRGAFLWRSLCRRHPAADLLLLRKPGVPPSGVAIHPGARGQFVLSVEDPALFADGVCHRLGFREEMEYRELLRWHRYEFVVFRGASLAKLAEICRETLPDCRVLIDMGNLVSGQPKTEGLSLRNRLSNHRARRLEERLLRRPYRLLVSDERDREWAKSRRGSLRENLGCLPNPPCAEVPAQPEDSIPSQTALFPSEPASPEAARFLLRRVYPEVHECLASHGWWLRVMAKPSLVDDSLGNGGGRVETTDEEACLADELSKAAVVVFPSQSPLDLRPLVEQAATVGRALILSSEGARGLDLDGVMVADSPSEIAEIFRELVANPAEAMRLGARLRESFLERRSQELAEVFWRELSAARPSGAPARESSMGLPTLNPADA